MPVSPFPAAEAHFDQNGAYVAAASTFSIDALAGATDLIVISHGWNNDDGQARTLYDAFFASVDSLRGAGTVNVPDGRVFHVVRVFWPSKQFDLPQPASGVAADAVNPNIAAAQLQLQRLIDATADPTAKASLEQAQNSTSTTADATRATLPF